MEENKVMETEAEEIKEEKKETEAEEATVPEKSSRIKSIVKWGLIGLGTVGVAATALAVVFGKKEEDSQVEKYSPADWNSMDNEGTEPKEMPRLVPAGGDRDNLWTFSNSGNPGDGVSFGIVDAPTKVDEKKPEET